MNLSPNFLGTKFFFAVIVTAMGFYLTIIGKATTQEFFTFVGVIGATYIVGNEADKLILSKK